MAVVVVVSAMLGAGQATAAEPATLIIFDGSGSMWGRLEGERRSAKVDLAREALKPLITKWPSGARLGLLSFGHRRSGDCSDIELLAPPVAGDTGRLTAALDKLNPRGKGPIAGALREAAKALADAPQSTIVLIHDNADNCRQDVCEAAREIASAAPRLKVDLVALALDSDELEAVSCIATATHGTVHNVRDQTGLAAALTAALDAARGPASGPPSATAAVSPSSGTAAGATSAADGAVRRGSEPAAVKPDPSGPPGLALSARLVANGPALALPIQWRIARTDNSAPAIDATAPTWNTPLEPGTYTVEARAGFATASRTIELGPAGLTPLEIAMEAAALRVNVRAIAGGQPNPVAIVSLTRATAADVSAGLASGNSSGTARGPDGTPGRPLWIGPAQEVDFVLPPGSYAIKTGEGLAAKQTVISLTAGQYLDVDMVTGAGNITLSAVARPDGEPVGAVAFLISTDAPEAKGGRREIARTAAPQATFALPAGTYYVTARRGAAEVRQRIAISAGDDIKRAIAMNLARLVVSLDAPSGGPSQKGASAGVAARMRVLNLDADRREIANEASGSLDLMLAPGRYRIEASVGRSNVSAGQDVELEGGSVRRLALKLEGTPLALSYAGRAVGQPAGPGSGLASAELSWDVRDAAGAVVMRSFEAAPTLILAPGKYLVGLETGTQRFEKPVDIAAGKSLRPIELAFP